MERRKAVIAAATATATLLAGAAAISLNTSLVGASGDDGVGQISPVEPAASPATVYIDEPGRTVLPDDDEYDDEHDEYDDDGFDGQESHDGDDDEHEYEGADDDD